MQLRCTALNYVGGHSTSTHPKNTKEGGQLNVLRMETAANRAERYLEFLRCVPEQTADGRLTPNESVHQLVG